jgi:hypothetical protein
MSQLIANFMKQQGFPDEPSDACNMRFKALYFQPRIVFPLVLVAIILKSAPLFIVLSAVLCWNVTVPHLNPFECFYNRFVAQPKGKPELTPAPAPRRFAQGLAAAFMSGTALCLFANWNFMAWVFEAFLIIAFSALLFGKFCLGAYVFYVLRGELAFANTTLPWARH